MSIPKSCPECREWKRQNEKDEIATCSVCNSKKRITGRQKIGFHRYKGVWELPTLCRACELHPERAEKKAKSEREKRSALENFREQKNFRTERAWDDPNKKLERVLEGQTAVEPVQVLASAEEYEKIYDPEHGNALEHIVGSKHGKDLMSTYGVSDKQGVLNMLKLVARSSDPDRVYEFVQDDGRVIKYDRKYKVMMVIIENVNPPPPNRILTAYPKSEGSIATQLTKGRWKPQKGKVV